MEHPATSSKPITLVIENYPGRSGCIVRFLSQFHIPYEVVHADGSNIAIPVNTAGIILSGGPQSVTRLMSSDGGNLRPVLDLLDRAERSRLPVLGICLGHQLLAAWAGGAVRNARHRVVGFQQISQIRESVLYRHCRKTFQSFQFHEDYVDDLPPNFEVLATSDSCAIESFGLRDGYMWGVQFHPEVTLSDGKAILSGQTPPLRRWNPASDVKSPYLIKSFLEVCYSSSSQATRKHLANLVPCSDG